MSKEYKFIFVKDLHIRPNNIKHPAGRTDNYYEEFESKLQQIKRYALRNNINHILCAGDIFDIKAKSKYNIDSIIYIENLLKDFTNSKAIKLITIAGNHDMPNSSRQELKNSIYGIMSRQEFLLDTNTLDQYSPRTFDFNGPNIFGVPYNSNLEELKEEIVKLNELANNPIYKDAVNILMLHEHCIPDTEKSDMFGVCIKYKELLSLASNFKIICAGHLHRGFETYKDKTTKQIIINSWCFTRLARDYYAVNNEHQPEFVEVIIKENKEIEVKHIPLECKSFNEAFVKTHLEVEKAYHNSISDFIAKIGEFKELDSSFDNAPEEIKDKINHFLELAEREVIE